MKSSGIDQNIGASHQPESPNLPRGANSPAFLCGKKICSTGGKPVGLPDKGLGALIKPLPLVQNGSRPGWEYDESMVRRIRNDNRIFTEKQLNNRNKKVFEAGFSWDQILSPSGKTATIPSIK